MVFSRDPGATPPGRCAPAATHSARGKGHAPTRRPLHGFNLTSWGSCKILRCRRTDENGGGSATPPSSNGGGGRRASRSPEDRVAALLQAEVEEEEEEGYERIEADEVDEDVTAFRKNLMSRYNSTVHSLREAVTSVRMEASTAPRASSGRKNSEERGDAAATAARQPSLGNKNCEERDDPAAAASASRPWNLRKRRAACTAPQENGQRQAQNQVLASAAERAAPKDEWPKFSIALSKENVSEDLAKIFGAKPPRKRKRPHKVQKVLDKVFPGLWLSDITRDSYKIADEK